MIQKCKFQKKMIHQFVSFLFWNLHFWVIFLHKLVDQYGSLPGHGRGGGGAWAIPCHGAAT